MASEMPEQSERTEAATPKRREDARRKGDVAQSREVQSVAVLAAVMLLLSSYLGVQLAQRVAAVAKSLWGGGRVTLNGVGDFQAMFVHAFAAAGAAMLPILLLLAAAGAAVGFMQVGPLFSLEALAPKANRMSLLSGFKRMFGPDRLFDLAKALFKVAVVGTITWLVVSASTALIVELARVPLAEGLILAARMGRRVALQSLAFLAVMAALDLVYVRMRHERKLRMSRREVRDELKDREGSPQVRSRARAMQRELSRARMIESVAQANVVVTNPTHFAVALEYRREMSAPRVLAKGRNHVARRIREIAKKNDVPIVENPPLARLLHRSVKVGQDIPEALFKAVAEVLAYVYRLDADRAKAWGASS